MYSQLKARSGAENGTGRSAEKMQQNVSDEPDFLSQFTPKERELLTSSMKQLEQLKEENAIKIFIRLFQENPAYKTLFPKLRFMGDADVVNSNVLAAHTQRMLQMLKVFISGFQHESTCMQVMKKAETAHCKLDIKASQVKTLFPILMEILHIENTETYAAWQKLFEKFNDHIEEKKLLYRMGSMNERPVTTTVTSIGADANITTSLYAAESK